MNQSIDRLHSCFFCLISWLRDWRATAALSNWRIIAYNIVLVMPYINMNQPLVHMFSPSWLSLPPPTPSHPSKLSQSTGFEIPLSYNKFPLAVLHMVMYMFQCCSLNSSHPLLPKVCLGVCSLCLHLHCCPANRLISAIFHIYIITYAFKNLLFSCNYSYQIARSIGHYAT